MIPDSNETGNVSVEAFLVIFTILDLCCALTSTNQKKKKQFFMGPLHL